MSVLDVKVKSGEHPKFYKSGINRLEKRIDQLEHQVFCCIPEEIAAAEEESVVLVVLSANDAGTGNWQTIVPGSGIEVIPAPGANKVNIISRMVLEITATADITTGSTTDPSPTLYQVAGGNDISESIDLTGVTGAVTDEIGVAEPAGTALADYVLNTGIILDVANAVPVLGTGDTATANIKIYYKTVSF